MKRPKRHSSRAMRHLRNVEKGHGQGHASKYAKKRASGKQLYGNGKGANKLKMDEIIYKQHDSHDCILCIQEARRKESEARKQAQRPYRSLHNSMADVYAGKWGGKRVAYRQTRSTASSNDQSWARAG